MVPGLCAVDAFLVPDRGVIVDSGIGLSYRLARLLRLAGRCDNLMLASTISPQSGTNNLASECMRVRQNNRI